MKKIIFQGYPHFYDRMEQFVKENETITSCDICFVGDSLVEMMEIDNFLNKKCVNRGIVSDQTKGVLMTLQDRVINCNPKEVFICVGTNDICNKYPVSEIFDNMETIIEYIKDKLKDVKIVITTVFPPCYYEAEHVAQIYPECRDILRIEGLNEKIKTLDSIDNVTVFDGFSILADENKSLSVDDTLDGVHLKPKAYEKIYKELAKYL